MDVAKRLGDRAAEVVRSIRDPKARSRVLGALEACESALKFVDDLDLEPHELAELGTPDLSVWESLAADVRNLLVEVRTTGDRLIDLYGDVAVENESVDMEELDAAFAEMESDEAPAPIRDNREADLDRIVASAATRSKQEIARNIKALGSMMLEDFKQFGARLRNPRVVADRWFLLAELHELKGKCSQCLEAVIATVLTEHTPENLETLLPRYLSSKLRAVRLRQEMTDLSYEIALLNDTLAEEDDDVARFLLTAMADAIGKFAQTDPYRWVRPSDKRELILFRVRVQALDEEARLLEMRRLGEGLTKFFETMRSINQREVLLQHDIEAFAKIERLAESADDAGLAAALRDVYGRDESLDHAIRSVERGTMPPRLDLAKLIQNAAAHVAMAASPF